MKSTSQIANRNTENLVATNGNVTNNRARYIGWRIKRYGPRVTKWLDFNGSGVTLKFPMPIVNTAQIPRARPKSSTAKRSLLFGKIGPVIAINPRHENCIITKVNDFKMFG